MSLITNQPTKDIEHIKSTFSWPGWYLKGHFRHFYMKKIPWKLLLQKSYHTNFQSPPYCYQFAAIILCPSSWYQDQDWLMDYTRAESRNDKRFLQYKFSNSTLLQTKQITFISSKSMLSITHDSIGAIATFVPKIVCIECALCCGY